jgi:hypothetical protein
MLAFRKKKRRFFFTRISADMKQAKIGHILDCDRAGQTTERMQCKEKCAPQ